MKSILLHTAAADNGLTRHEAGAEISVGDKPDQIAADRAAALVDAGTAIAVPAAAKGRAAPPVQPDSSSDEAE